MFIIANVNDLAKSIIPLRGADGSRKQVDTPGIGRERGASCRKWLPTISEKLSSWHSKVFEEISLTGQVQIKCESRPSTAAYMLRALLPSPGLKQGRIQID